MPSTDAEEIEREQLPSTLLSEGRSELASAMDHRQWIKEIGG
jgi:hypothetical protein